LPPFISDAPVLGVQKPNLLVRPGSALSLDPEGREVASLGQEAIDLATLCGLDLDPWQQLVLTEMCAVQRKTYTNPFMAEEGGWIGDPEADTPRIDNKWAAKEFGLVVARQNGKGSILEARELAGLFLWGERLIIHTAHLFPTAVEAFNRILFLIQNNPELDQRVYKVNQSHGNEGIELMSGQRLIFKARSKGNIRGFTADTIIFDEAMSKLGSEEVKAMSPSVSARPNPQFLFTGSAGNQDSEHFGMLRNRAINAEERKEKFFCWVEWSVQPCDAYCAPDCEEHDRPGDPKTWAKANPAMGYRLDEEWIAETEYKGMRLDDFLMERCSVGDWPADGNGWRIIPKGPWQDRRDEFSELSDGKIVLAVDASLDGSWSAIAAAGENWEGDTHVELTGVDEAVDYRPGMSWVVPRIKKIIKFERPAFIVVNPDSPARTLIPELEKLGIPILMPTSRERAEASADFKRGIAPKGGEKATLTHIGQAPLDQAAAGADKKEVGELWVFSKLDSGVDITPLTASAWAVWGFKTHVFSKRSTPWVD
jgi:hypothetical protein